jgi:hypothetical protein
VLRTRTLCCSRSGLTLYFKADVDAYVVEDRGVKVAEAQKARSGKPVQTEGGVYSTRPLKEVKCERRSRTHPY